MNAQKFERVIISHPSKEQRITIYILNERIEQNTHPPAGQTDRHSLPGPAAENSTPRTENGALKAGPESVEDGLKLSTRALIGFLVLWRCFVSHEAQSSA